MVDRHRALLEATQEAALTGPGALDPGVRTAAAKGEPPPELKVLVEKIRLHAYRVTTEEILELKARYTEDQLFELIVATTLGAAKRRFDAAMTALEQA